MACSSKASATTAIGYGVLGMGKQQGQCPLASCTQQPFSRFFCPSPSLLALLPNRPPSLSPPHQLCHCSPPPDDTHLPFIQDIVIPLDWTSPTAASQESEWLRVTLHKWLDDEFCPEPPNEEISRRCSKVYYYCLMEKQLDVGDILMQMVRELETFSFKESFHGAFSSANAAIDLITKKVRSLERNS